MGTISSPQSGNIEYLPQAGSSSDQNAPIEEKTLPLPTAPGESQIREAKKITFEKSTVLRGNISAAANKIDHVDIAILGEHLENEQLANTVVEALKKVDSIGEGKIAAFDGKFLKISIGDNLHVYARYHKKNNSLQVLFDKNNPLNIQRGGYKELFQGYMIRNTQEIGRLILTKEAESPEKRTDDPRDSNLYREQTTLNICREKNIPGTPETFLISNYDHKNGLGKKQAILSKFYTGGDLVGINGFLSDEHRLHIGYKLTETLAALHQHGINYNDLKMDNVVLDKMGNPILIDYGGATLDVDLEGRENPRFTSTAEIYAPELFNESHRTEMTQLLHDLHQKLGESEVIGAELREKADEYLVLIVEFQQPHSVEEMAIITANKSDAKKALDLLEEKDVKINQEWKAVHINFKSLVDDERDFSGYIPKKNDDYALGLLILRLHGGHPEGPIKEIVDGLLEVDPSKRITSQQAHERYQAILNR